MHARRTIVGGLALLVLLGLSFGLLSRFVPAFRALFGRDSENPEEMRALAERKDDHVAPVDPAAGWPQWRGPHRDGRAPQTPFRTDWAARPPKPLWTAPCGGGFSSFAVVGGRAYTQDKQGDTERVICLDAETGKPLWEHGYPAGPAGRDRSFAVGPRATPTVEGNRIYAVGGSGKFLCLDLSGGQPTVAWEHDLLGEFDAELPQWGVASSPLVEGDLVIVQPGGKNGSVAAFDKQSGALRWKAGSNPNGYSSPMAATVGGVRVIYALTGDALLAVRAGDGAVTASYPWRTQYNGNIATPVVVGDYVFISSGYAKGCALLRAAADGDRVTLTEVYIRNNRVMRNHHATCVYRDWHLYGFDDSRLKCVDLKKGLDVPDWEPTRVNKGTLILVENNLLILTEGGELILAEATPTEYKELGRMASGLGGGQNWALPVVADGRLFLRDNQKVICLDVR